MQELLLNEKGCLIKKIASIGIKLNKWMQRRELLLLFMVLSDNYAW